MMNDTVYQAIFDAIAPLLPAECTKLIVYLEYGENSYSFSFFYKDNQKYIKCFDMPGVSEDAIMSSFKKIDEIVAPERSIMKGELWSNMTMVVDEDGNMHVDFDYTDLSSGTYPYRKIWKEKYLV